MSRSIRLTSAAVGAALAALTFASTTTISAPTDEQLCLAAKEKALAKLEGCVWKANAKAATTGTSVDTTLCESKFTEAWVKPDAKYGADCPDATAASILALFDGHVEDVLGQIGSPSSACGNGTIDAGEECDGVSLGGESCSGAGYGNDGALSCDGTCNFAAGTCQGCSVFDQNCPIGSDSCGIAGGGDTACAPPGTATEGQDCLTDGCVESNVCVSDGMTTVCRQVCHVGGEPSCPAGFDCFPLQDYDEIGACIPN